MIGEVLAQRAYLPPSVHIAANRMRFDQDGVLSGFKDPCFHVFNKEASAVREEPYFAHIRGRRHVLLLGDNLGDLKMSHGAPRLRHGHSVGRGRGVAPATHGVPPAPARPGRLRSA